MIAIFIRVMLFFAIVITLSALIFVCLWFLILPDLRAMKRKFYEWYDKNYKKEEQVAKGAEFKEEWLTEQPPQN